MTDPRPPLSAPAEAVQRQDPDRFFTALFAPADRRETLLLLYAFNIELARAREVASDPMIALIRLQWWREVVEGADRRHEIAAPLAAAIAAGALHRDDLLAMIDGREAETEDGMIDLAHWRAYLTATAGGVAVAAGRLLGTEAGALDGLRELGAAYGAAGVLRGVAALARQQRCLLPADVLAAHGLSPEAVTAAPGDPALRPALAALAREGEVMLAAGATARLPRAALAAALPATLARRDLRRARGGVVSGAPRGVGDRLAILTAVVRGRP